MKYENVINILRGLSFFKRSHCNGTPIRSWLLAAYHHPRSLTWRWGIWYSMRKAGKTGVYFMRVYRSQGFNFHAGINLPLFGSVSMQTQPHMWNKPRRQSAPTEPTK